MEAQLNKTYGFLVFCNLINLLRIFCGWQYTVIANIFTQCHAVYCREVVPNQLAQRAAQASWNKREDKKGMEYAGQPTCRTILHLLLLILQSMGHFSPWLPCTCCLHFQYFDFYTMCTNPAEKQCLATQRRALC